MKTALATTTPDAGLAQIREIPIEDLFPSPDNPRKSYDQAAMEELARTIADRGVQVPLLVRPQGLSFEIVAGWRRWTAAGMAKKATVPCMVREMTDGQAREAALIDNLQRADVPALEEAEAFNALLPLHGSIEAVAARVGKDVAHVAKRLRLCSLGEHSRQALAERLITVDHALLLARLGAVEENDALKWALQPQAGVKVKVDAVIADVKRRRKDEADDKGWRGWEPQSVLLLKHHIERGSGKKLKTAPWRLDAEGLISGLPACNACPSNTKSNTALFADLDIDDATCAEGICFDSKRAAFVQIQMSSASDRDGKPALRLSWKRTGAEPRKDKKLGGPDLGQLFKAGQWVEAKKGSCTWARPGITVDWKADANRGYMGASSDAKQKPGEELLVCVAEACKVHKKEWQKPKSASGQMGGYDAKAEEEKREKTRLGALAETRLRARLAGEAIEKVKKLPEQLLRNFLIEKVPGGDTKKLYETVLPGLEKASRTAPLDSIEFARAVALLSIPDWHLELYHHCAPTANRKEFISDLKLIGYDASKAWDKPKVEKKPPAKKAAKKAVGKKSKAAAISLLKGKAAKR